MEGKDVEIVDLSNKNGLGKLKEVINELNSDIHGLGHIKRENYVKIETNPKINADGTINLKNTKVIILSDNFNNATGRMERQIKRIIDAENRINEYIINSRGE